MPFRYRIDPREPIVRCEASADANVPAWEAMMDRLLADPAFRPGLGFLNDFRAMSPPTREEIAQVQAYLVRASPRLGSVRWAVVVADLASYGMTRMLDLMLEGEAGRRITVQGFTAPAEAEAWLLAATRAPRTPG